MFVVLELCTGVGSDGFIREEKKNSGGIHILKLDERKREEVKGREEEGVERGRKVMN